MSTNGNCSTPTDFLEYMASFKNFNGAVNNDSDSSDEVQIVSEHGATNHRCDLCCEGEFLIDKLQRFGGLINEKYKFVCDKCDKNFVYKSELTKHATQCTGPVYNSEVLLLATKKASNIIKCGTCPKTFKTQRGCNKHINSQHSGLTHTCEICKKVFTNFQKFSHHHLKHCFERPPYVCIFCDKRFKSEGDLNYHSMKVHNLEKFAFKKSKTC